MEKQITITERQYILISKGLHHLTDEYKNYGSSKHTLKEIKELKEKLVKPFLMNIMKTIKKLFTKIILHDRTIALTVYVIAFIITIWFSIEH